MESHHGLLGSTHFQSSRGIVMATDYKPLAEVEDMSPLSIESVTLGQRFEPRYANLRTVTP